MSLLKERELRKQVESNGIQSVESHIIESLKNGDLKPSDISLKELAAATFVDKATGKPMGLDVLAEMTNGPLSENMANVVSLSAFSNITQQFMFNAILEGFQLDQGSIAEKFGVINSNVVAQGERVPGISNIGDAAKILGETEEIPMAAVGEEYIDCPIQNRSGFIVPLSRPALIGDRTGLLVERCRAVGEMMRINREKEACDIIINANGATPRLPKTNGSAPYSWKGSNYSIWQTSNAAAPFFDNVTASNGLVDAQSINNAWLTLTQITDPNTGEPLADSGRYTLLCTPQNKYTAMRVLHGLQYRTVGGTAATANMAPMLVSGGETVVGDFDIVSSKYLSARLAAASQADTHWYFGNFEKAFKWMRAMDLLVEEALPNSGVAFLRDIPMMFRALKYETASVHQPRVVTKCTVA